MKHIRVFLSENFHFLVVIFSVYLNRRVFVMPKNKLWHFMRIVSIGRQLQEITKPTLWKKNKKTISECRLVKLLSSILSVNPCPAE